MADFTPIIGKNVIETLTLGMYDDAHYIFREYVQNAADQIDVAVENKILARKSDGKINIVINKQNRHIAIEDNATGIKADSVLQFLGDVANSEKDSTKRKGFRGIGRLGGLGYCEKLVFRTSYKGENVESIMSLDARQLKNIILDKNITLDASTVISVITTIERQPAKKEEHYFKVILEHVTNDKILDDEAVKDYLSMVAPLPFNKEFSFANEIKEQLKKHNVILDEYDVMLNVNGNQLYKRYKDNLVEKDEPTPVLGVDFFEIRDYEDELIAIGWYGFRGLSNYVLSPSNLERGIRLRKNNIAIGDENTMSRFFKTERTNLRFIGEVHAISSSFIPNARRDYFNDNKTCQVFEEKLSDIFETEDWENTIAQNASKIKNRLKEIEDYKAAKINFENQKGKFRSESEEKHNLRLLKVQEKKAIDAQRLIGRIKSQTATDPKVKKLYDYIVADKDINVIPNSSNANITKYAVPAFNKLSQKESGIVLNIFSLIDSTITSFTEASLLKEKIVKLYN